MKQIMKAILLVVLLIFSVSSALSETESITEEDSNEIVELVSEPEDNIVVSSHYVKDVRVAGIKYTPEPEDYNVSNGDVFIIRPVINHWGLIEGDQVRIDIDIVNDNGRFIDGCMTVATFVGINSSDKEFINDICDVNRIDYDGVYKIGVELNNGQSLNETNYDNNYYSEEINIGNVTICEDYNIEITDIKKDDNKITSNKIITSNKNIMSKAKSF